MTFSTFAHMNFTPQTSQLTELPDWQIENGKALFMRYLYEIYDRANAEPGLRGTTSGLWQQFQSDLAEYVRDEYILSALTEERQLGAAPVIITDELEG
jgi:hypothetical protein